MLGPSDEENDYARYREDPVGWPGPARVDDPWVAIIVGFWYDNGVATIRRSRNIPGEYATAEEVLAAAALNPEAEVAENLRDQHSNLTWTPVRRSEAALMGGGHREEE